MGKAPAVRAAVTALADAVLAVVLAPSCACCNRPLDQPTAGAVCRSCWSSIVPIRPPVCDRCGDPLPSWRVLSIQHARCPRCRRRAPVVTHARAIGAYDGALRAIVHALKYDGRRRLAKPLGERLRVSAADLLDGADAAVPVPLHASRRRARGYNQATEIARHLGLPVCAALKRIRATRSQTDLPEARRHANVRGAFRMRRSIDVSGLTIVLVDDVSTTGATMEACARVLRDAGAREVRAVTAARVVSLRR